MQFGVNHGAAQRECECVCVLTDIIYMYCLFVCLFDGWFVFWFVCLILFFLDFFVIFLIFWDGGIIIIII
jgi:hypothetical protein